MARGRFRLAQVWIALLGAVLACSLPVSSTPSTPIGLPTAQLQSPDAPASPTFPAPSTSQAEVPTTERTEGPSPPRTKYSIEAWLDYPAYRLRVAQEIEYPNNSGETIGELVLVVEAQRVLFGFTLNTIKVGGEAVSNYNLKDGLLRVPLATPLQPAETLTVALDYLIILPLRSGPFSHNQRQANFTDWYPFVPPYVAGQGWLVHPAAVIGEHLVYEAADFDVRIYPSDPNLFIAASAPAEAMEGGYRYQVEGVRNFAWAASPDYVVLGDEVEGVPVWVYVYPEHREVGEYLLKTVSQAQVKFGEKYGRYPRPSLSVVEIEYSDGYEHDGLFFMGSKFLAEFDGTPQNMLTILTVHEFSHEWWYAEVGSDQALEPWLDEALATYSELVYYEAVHPEFVEWWWETRIEAFAPGGAVGSTIYDFSRYDPYITTVYRRGAQFLHELRGLMGDEAFFGFLQAYFDLGADRIMTGEGFFTLLVQHTDADIEALRVKYFGE